jgi:hypothetical protein
MSHFVTECYPVCGTNDLKLGAIQVQFQSEIEKQFQVYRAPAFPVKATVVK